MRDLRLRVFTCVFASSRACVFASSRASSRIHELASSRLLACTFTLKISKKKKTEVLKGLNCVTMGGSTKKRPRPNPGPLGIFNAHVQRFSRPVRLRVFMRLRASSRARVSMCVFASSCVFHGVFTCVFMRLQPRMGLRLHVFTPLCLMRAPSGSLVRPWQLRCRPRPCSIIFV